MSMGLSSNAYVHTINEIKNDTEHYWVVNGRVMDHCPAPKELNFKDGHIEYFMNNTRVKIVYANGDIKYYNETT